MRETSEKQNVNTNTCFLFIFLIKKFYLNKKIPFVELL